MKRFKMIMLLTGVLLSLGLGAQAMSMSKMRNETRFLTDLTI